MKINTKIQVKTIVSSLRRELKAINKPTDEFSHNDCLALLAKAMGFANWNEWEATLVENPVEKPAAADVEVKAERYPLVNHGDFDFIPYGEMGTPFSGFFQKLDGTIVRVPGFAFISRAGRHGNPEALDFDIDYDGQTNLDWNSQESKKDDQGAILWADEEDTEYSGAQVVFLPEDYSGEPYTDEDLPIRQKLVQHFVDYCKEHQITVAGVTEALTEIEKTLGFCLTKKEESALRAILANNA